MKPHAPFDIENYFKQIQSSKGFVMTLEEGLIFEAIIPPALKQEFLHYTQTHFEQEGREDASKTATHLSVLARLPEIHATLETEQQWRTHKTKKVN